MSPHVQQSELQTILYLSFVPSYIFPTSSHLFMFFSMALFGSITFASITLPFCRVWEVKTGEVLNTLIHHNEAVLHLRFANGLMVTCSKDRSIAVWDMASPTDISLRRVLVGHRAAVNVVDFDDKYIVSASGDRTIKVTKVHKNTSSSFKTFLKVPKQASTRYYCYYFVILSSSIQGFLLFSNHKGGTLHLLLALFTANVWPCHKHSTHVFLCCCKFYFGKKWKIALRLLPTSSQLSLIILYLSKESLGADVFKMKSNAVQKSNILDIVENCYPLIMCLKEYL